MKIIIKKSSLIFIMSVLTLLIVLFGACDCDGEEAPETNLTLSNTTMDIGFLDSFYLSAEYEIINDEVLTFESSNTNVCTVASDGLVVGVGLGEAKITAKYADLTNECTVKVSEKSLKPIITFENIFKDSVVIREEESLDLSCYILYDKTIYKDATFEYTVKNPDVGSVVDGVFVASKIDDSVEFVETDIEVKTTWRGFDLSSLTTNLKVKVVNLAPATSDYIAINNSCVYPTQITLRVGESYDFVCRRVVNGVEQSAVVNLVGSCVQYTNDVITAINEGQAAFIVKIADDTSSAPIPELAEVTIIVTVVT